MKNLIWIYGRSVKRRKAINEMSGNIPGRNFLGRNFSGESLRGGNFPGGIFPERIPIIFTSSKRKLGIKRNTYLSKGGKLF